MARYLASEGYVEKMVAVSLRHHTDLPNLRMPFEPKPHIRPQIRTKEGRLGRGLTGSFVPHMVMTILPRVCPSC